MVVRHPGGKPQIGFSDEFIKRATPLEANAKMEKWLRFFLLKDSEVAPGGITEEGDFYEDGVD